jgi:hypothetical protein
VWTDDPHQFKGVRIIFQDFEASNWTWDPTANAYTISRYREPQSLPVGQGMWVFSYVDTTVSLQAAKP